MFNNYEIMFNNLYVFFLLNNIYEISLLKLLPKNFISNNSLVLLIESQIYHYRCLVLLYQITN